MKLIAAIAVVAGLWWWFRARRPRLSRSDAARLLDVAEDASPEIVRAAHRRVISRVHPDVGGTPELAARINAARDRMLRP